MGTLYAYTVGVGREGEGTWVRGRREKGWEKKREKGSVRKPR